LVVHFAANPALTLHRTRQETQAFESSEDGSVFPQKMVPQKSPKAWDEKIAFVFFQTAAVFFLTAAVFSSA
jgi:hypothetical protein